MILSSSASEASPVGNPTPHAKERPDLHSSTHLQHGADMYDESETEEGITDEECSDMQIEYISLQKLKREIRRADHTGDQVFLCCMPRPACWSIKCTRCKPVMTMTGLTSFGANCRFHYTSGRAPTSGRRRSMETYLRIDLVEIIEYASIWKTIHRWCTLTKWTRVN